MSQEINERFIIRESVSQLAGKDTEGYRIRAKTVKDDSGQTVTVYKMDSRIRQVWSQISSFTSDHFGVGKKEVYLTGEQMGSLREKLQVKGGQKSDVTQQDLLEAMIKRSDKVTNATTRINNASNGLLSSTLKNMSPEIKQEIVTNFELKNPGMKKYLDQCGSNPGRLEDNQLTFLANHGIDVGTGNIKNLEKFIEASVKNKLNHVPDDQKEQLKSSMPGIVESYCQDYLISKSPDSPIEFTLSDLFSAIAEGRSLGEIHQQNVGSQDEKVGKVSLRSMIDFFKNNKVDKDWVLDQMFSGASPTSVFYSQQQKPSKETGSPPTELKDATPITHDPQNTNDPIHAFLGNLQTKWKTRVEGYNVDCLQVRRVAIECGEGHHVEALYLRGVREDGSAMEQNERTMILYHAKDETAYDLAEKAAYYQGLGFNVLMPTMGGEKYPTVLNINNKFTPSESSLYKEVDAEVAFLGKLGVKEMGVHGTSMGGAKAMQAAVKYGNKIGDNPQVRFVVADQTFSSVSKAAGLIANNSLGVPAMIAEPVVSAMFSKKTDENDNELNGFNNAEKAEELRKSDVVLFSITATKDEMMSKKKGESFGKNIGTEIAERRYSGDEVGEHSSSVEGGHCTRFEDNEGCKKKIGTGIGKIEWKSVSQEETSEQKKARQAQHAKLPTAEDKKFDSAKINNAADDMKELGW